MKSRLALILVLLCSVNLAIAEQTKRYEVSITNITKGQTFTPQFVATHIGGGSLFTLGKPASASLELLAEAGDTAPLTAEILTIPSIVGHVLTVPGLLGPGKTTTFEIKAENGHNYITFAAMLLPTNDTLVALLSMKLPDEGSVSYTALAYDAGTEENDQNCAHIPGPRCGGEAHSMQSDKDEGFIYISNGFHDLGDMDDQGNEILGPNTYDWRNSVAQITVKKMATD